MLLLLQQLDQKVSSYRKFEKEIIGLFDMDINELNIVYPVYLCTMDQ